MLRERTLELLVQNVQDFAQDLFPFRCQSQNPNPTVFGRALPIGDVALPLETRDVASDHRRTDQQLSSDRRRVLSFFDQKECKELLGRKPLELLLEQVPQPSAELAENEEQFERPIFHDEPPWG